MIVIRAAAKSVNERDRICADGVRQAAVRRFGVSLGC